MTATKRRNPLDRYARDLGVGHVTWIGVRPKRREPLISVHKTNAVAGLGLEGDHRMTKSLGSGRQLTLISQEFIDQIAYFTGHSVITPETLRRNLVVSGINLNGLRRQRFKIGDVLLEATQLCHPCARMEQALGRGGVAAMMGHGGLCAKILEDGVICVGDTVKVIMPDDNGESTD